MREKLAGLTTAAIAELQRRGYDIRGTPAQIRHTGLVVLILVVGGVAMFWSPAQPDSTVPHKEESLAKKYSNMTEQQLIESLPEGYIKVLNRQKSLTGSGLEAARTTREMAEIVASGVKADQKVVAIIDAIIRLEEQSVPHIRSQGIQYLANKQYDLAIEKFDEAISLGDASLYYNRGTAWLEKHEYDRAIADFTQALKSEHGFYFAYIHRAEAFERKGDRDSAIADYRRALEIAPDKTIADQTRATLRRLGYVEIGATVDRDRASRATRSIPRH